MSICIYSQPSEHLWSVPMDKFCHGKEGNCHIKGASVEHSYMSCRCTGSNVCVLSLQYFYKKLPK